MLSLPRPAHAQPGEKVEIQVCSVRFAAQGKLYWEHFTQGYRMKELFASEGRAGVAFSLKGSSAIPVGAFESISASDCRTGPRLQK